MEKKSTYIKERILEVIKSKGIKVSKFFPEIGESYENFKGKKLQTALMSDTIVKIITRFPTVNALWLLTGEGEMLHSAPPHDDKLFEYLQEQNREKDKKIEALLIENTQLKIEIERLRPYSTAPCQNVG